MVLLTSPSFIKRISPKNFNDRRALTQLLGRDVRTRLDDPAGVHKSEVFRYRGSRGIYIT